MSERKVGGSRRGNAGKGRKKGVPNKTTQAIKDAITEAFDKMGGVRSLVAWGTEQPTEFYKLWAKMAPVQMEHSGNADAPLYVVQVPPQFASAEWQQRYKSE